MPSYEEMIVIALQQIKEPEGLAPKTVFDYMSTYVHPSCDAFCFAVLTQYPGCIDTGHL